MVAAISERSSARRQDAVHQALLRSRPGWDRSARPRIAIASSGLGHVARGVESWANDLAIALHRRNADVSLFQGAGRATESFRHILACCRRFEPRTRRIFSVTRRLGGRRVGCGSEYEIEQTTFAWSLWRAIRRDYDILHIQDPTTARILDLLYRYGWSRPRVVLGNGTDEPDSELRKYRYLQHVAPQYQQSFDREKAPGQLSFAVPYFVDTGLFRPGNRAGARALWNLPENAIVVLSVAALKKHHKRCDYVIREFAAFRETCTAPAYLVLAGSRERETGDIIDLGRSLLGTSLRIYESLDRSKLPSLYHAADMFAIGSLHEMFGIAMLEALACGLPVSCHCAPVLAWVAGPGGAPDDISQPGGLVRQWERLLDPQVRARYSAAARRHAEEVFSEAVVVQQVLDMYATVLASTGPTVSWRSRIPLRHDNAC